MAKPSQNFSISKRLKSFKYAFEGLKYLIKHEHNTWIHLVATILVIIFSILFEISKLEWIAIALCVAMVWITEGINTAIEKLCDMYSRDYNEQIKTVKDITAAVVLIAATIAVCIAVIIFIPRILEMIKAV